MAALKNRINFKNCQRIRCFLSFKATIDRYFYRGGVECGGLRRHYEPNNEYNNNNNSNSFRSQSVNTCSSVVSTTTQFPPQHQPPRYPLVVSFRKIPRSLNSNNNNNPRPIQLSSHEEQHQIRARTQTLDSDYWSLRPPPPSMRLSVNETNNPVYTTPVAFGNPKPKNNNDHDDDDDDNFIVPVYYKKLYGSTAKNHPQPHHQFVLKQKRIYNSPYDSPEMTLDSINLEQNLKRILQELVFKGGRVGRPTVGHTTNLISKSRSMPSFFPTGQ